MTAWTSRRFDRARAGGFTYVGLLLAIALMGVALAAAGTLWSTDAKRERERELLFVGDQYRQALASYQGTAPAGQPNAFPTKLEDLVLDRRWPTVRRHLRKIYPDPITGTRDWGLVRGPAEMIVGIYSRSTDAPLKQAGFPKEYESFEKAKAYNEWKFAPALPQANQESKKAGSTAAQQQGTPATGGFTLSPPGAPTKDAIK